MKLPLGMDFYKESVLFVKQVSLFKFLVCTMMDVKLHIILLLQLLIPSGK